MKKFSENLREDAIKIINYKKPLTIEEERLYHQRKVCYICKRYSVLITKNITESEIIATTLPFIMKEISKEL